MDESFKELLDKCIEINTLNNQRRLDGLPFLNGFDDYGGKKFHCYNVNKLGLPETDIRLEVRSGEFPIEAIVEIDGYTLFSIHSLDK